MYLTSFVVDVSFCRSRYIYIYIVHKYMSIDSRVSSLSFSSWKVIPALVAGISSCADCFKMRRLDGRTAGSSVQGTKSQHPLFTDHEPYKTIPAPSISHLFPDSHAHLFAWEHSCDSPRMASLFLLVKYYDSWRAP